MTDAIDMQDLEALFADGARFEAAERYFAERVPVPASVFYRLAERYRSLAFTVSGYTSAKILREFYDALQEALQEGETIQAFRARTREFLEAEGYSGLTPWQADNVFRTNIQTAYQVGHYEAMTDPAVKALRPYWQYDAVNDSRTRPSHLAMDGKVFPADHPVWDTWYPPNGFKCRCTVRTLSARQVKAMGLEVLNELPRRIELPDGRVVPMQPDPKFRTNPAKTRWQPDLTGYPDSIVKAYKAREAAKSAEKD